MQAQATAQALCTQPHLHVQPLHAPPLTRLRPRTRAHAHALPQVHDAVLGQFRGLSLARNALEALERQLAEARAARAAQQLDAPMQGLGLGLGLGGARTPVA